MKKHHNWCHESHGHHLMEHESGEWYACTEVDARIAEHQSLAGLQKIRIERLETALRDIMAFEPGKLRTLADEIKIHEIAKTALALMER